MIEFNIKAPITGKGRPRFTKIGHTYTPAKTKEYENIVKASFLQSKQHKLHGYVHAQITVEYPLLKSMSKKVKEDCLNGTQMPDKKPDLDNIAKIILDALNGLAYEDDKQIISLHIEKKYGTEANVNVMLKER